MSRLTIGSIITATLLIVGCGNNGGSSTPTTSSLSDSSTPSNSSEANSVAQKIGKGYYVDSAVEGVDYQCDNQKGTTDENGTFTFKSGSDCNFTLGGIKLRDINGSLLEDNITILETNETVAQLLQTLDSDGNASNGIQISKGVGKVIRETLPSLSDLNQDLLEAIHDRLKSELKEYHGKVVDRNQTIEHLNRTKAELEARHIRTHLDVEAEHRHRGRRDNNDSMSGSININGHHSEDSNNSIRDELDTHRGDINETGHNNSYIDMDNNGSMGEVMSGVHTHSHSNSNSDENSSPRNSVANSLGDMMRGNGEERESHNNQEQQEHSNNSSSQSHGVDDNTSMPPFTSNMGNHNSSNSQEQEHSGSSSSQQTGSHSQSNSGNNSNQSGSENHNNQNSSSNGSSHTSPTGRRGF